MKEGRTSQRVRKSGKERLWRTLGHNLVALASEMQSIIEERTQVTSFLLRRGRHTRMSIHDGQSSLPSHLLDRLGIHFRTFSVPFRFRQDDSSTLELFVPCWWVESGRSDEDDLGRGRVVGTARGGEEGDDLV